MHRKFLLIFVMLFLSITIYAQKDTVNVPGLWESNGTYGTLNDAIDNAIADGTISNKVFKLTPYEQYVLSRSIYLDHGQDLEIYAPKAGATQDDAPPQILWTEESIDRGYVIQSYGDVKISNVWFRFADVLGSQVNGGIVFENQEAAADPEIGHFDGCIFDYNGIGAESGGTITVKADHFEGQFENCYWRNNADKHFRYYGRAVSFPYQSTEWHYDKLVFENCSFANLARIVMMEGNENATLIQLNHCTMLNNLETIVENGWWQNYSVTNSIFFNPSMLGFKAIDVCDEDQDLDDFEDGLCEAPAGGLVAGITEVDSLGFEVDFTDAQRALYVGNVAYVRAQYMKDWYINAPSQLARTQQRQGIENYFPTPMVGQSVKDWQDSVDTDGITRVFPNINVDSTSIIFDGDPQFAVEATNQDTMLMFVDYKWDLNQDVDWAYMPNSGLNQTWPLPEDLRVQNADFLKAAMGGFPLGDLNWMPEYKADWKAQKEAEWAKINDLLFNNGTDVKEVNNVLPTGYELEQNYPNPFNPVTNIKYSIPEDGFVSLKVYNNLGQEVQNIFAGEQSAGNYIATFNASNLASGVYFYTLKASNVVMTKKLVLMK